MKEIANPACIARFAFILVIHGEGEANDLAPIGGFPDCCIGGDAPC
jgi:hypothetical protein